MVSFWPWRSDDSSPASFEKTLSALSAKITDTQARLDGLRARSRRVRVLWTLYLSFAYLVYSIVIILVVGSQKMGPYEWTGIAGGPVVIYVTRTSLAGYYTYRIDSLTSKLKDQQAERAKTIQKLKDATKYDTTLELLEKYGGPEQRPRSRRDSGSEGEGKEPGHGKQPQHGLGGQPHVNIPGRTGLPPPPTANIQRRPPPDLPPPGAPNPDIPLPAPFSGSVPITEEFAPNAFSQPPPPPAAALSPQSYGQYEGPGAGPHWYDRILDLLLGEDEMAAKNRIVLICQTCRLVNGQAPPGTKRLSDVGMWKCMGCGAMNGELDEGKKLVREVLEASKTRDEARQSGGTDDGEENSSDLVEIEKEDGEDEDVAGTTTGNDTQETRSGGARRRKGK